MILPIIYQDEHLVVINKPHNLLVHRSPIAAQETVFALQILRDQLGQWVSPVHRIDRKTSGILVFSLHDEADKVLKKQFENREVSKKYLALVRGFMQPSGLYDRPLENDKGISKEAVTYYRSLEQFELPIMVSKYPQSRYSLVELEPKTGRMHQLRRHLAQDRHYLIGDKLHGECKHNKMFEEKFGLDTMLLHASELHCTHPITQLSLYFTAPLSSTFSAILDQVRCLNHMAQVSI